MAKINVKIMLKNDKELSTYTTSAIKLDNVIKYAENDIKVIVSIDNDIVTLIRENNEYQLKLIFENMKKTKGNYLLKDNNVNIKLDIFTKSLSIEENRLNIIYVLNDVLREYTLIEE